MKKLLNHIWLICFVFGYIWRFVVLGPKMAQKKQPKMDRKMEAESYGNINFRACAALLGLYFGSPDIPFGSQLFGEVLGKSTL